MKGVVPVAVSSGAALRGSPVSGGYAGAKRTQWFIAEYAIQEAARLQLGLRFQTLLPKLNPNTELGRAAVEAYAARAGVSPEEFVKRLGTLLTPARMGEAVIQLFTEPLSWDRAAYEIGGEGLTPL